MSRQKPSKDVIKRIGSRCINCGSDECIEYHHIIPLFLGGNDIESNIVPLCHKCHQVAHKGRHISHYTNKKNTGRKKICDDDRLLEIIEMFVNGEIGNIKAIELTGQKPGARLSADRRFSEWKKEHGIKTVRNQVDYLAINTYKGLVEGDRCVSITYDDGHEEFKYWHNTGKNDVDYEKAPKIVERESQRAEAELERQRKLAEEHAKGMAEIDAIAHHVSEYNGKKYVIRCSGENRYHLDPIDDYTTMSFEGFLKSKRQKKA